MTYRSNPRRAGVDASARRRSVANAIRDVVTKTCRGPGCTTRSSQTIFIGDYCPSCHEKRLAAEAAREEQLKHYSSLGFGDFA